MPSIQAPARGGYNARVTVETAITDHSRRAIIEIQHRRKTEIHVHVTEFGGHEPAGTSGHGQRLVGITVIQTTDGAHGWEAGQPRLETLYAPALLVHSNQQPGPNAANGLDQRPELRRRLVVTVEKNDTANSLMAEPLVLNLGEAGAFNINHQWTGHCSSLSGNQRWLRTDQSPSRMLTGVPGVTHSQS